MSDLEEDLDATVQSVVQDAERLLRDIDGEPMGEMESLRLQMAMDRMSKMMATLSNLLKKSSETAQCITQNMK